jgi:hypothetical protein
MRDLKRTNIHGKIYLYPVPVEKEKKYLIYCASEEECQLILQGVQEGKLTHPDLVGESFIFLGLHSDQQTKIFGLKTTLSN